MADPLADLLKNDMAGLPPTFIIAAGLDPLQDDSTALHRLMTDAGVPVAFKRYEGVLHGFLHLSRMVDQADQAQFAGVVQRGDLPSRSRRER